METNSCKYMSLQSLIVSRVSPIFCTTIFKTQLFYNQKVDMILKIVRSCKVMYLQLAAHNFFRALSNKVDVSSLTKISIKLNYLKYK
jgi:hypothetical protein